MSKTSVEKLQEESGSHYRKPMVVQSMAGWVIEKIALLEETMFYKRAAYAIETAFIDFAIEKGFIRGSEPDAFPSDAKTATKAAHVRDVDNLTEFMHVLADRFNYLIENERTCHIRAQYIADFIENSATFPDTTPIVRPTHHFEKQEECRYVWTMSPIHLELASKIGVEHFNQKRARPVVFSAVVDAFTKKLQMTEESPYPKFSHFPRKELLRVPNSADLFVLAAIDGLSTVGKAARRHKTSKAQLRPLRDISSALGAVMVQAQNTIYERPIKIPNRVGGVR